MKTNHKIYFKNSSDMGELESNSIDLMITSPPYPMIEMWDVLFSSLNNEIKQALNEDNGKIAFTLMHKELEKVWSEVNRVLKPGGIACINIGDATRKIGRSFQLFPNHVKITNFFQNNNFIELPSILWRKPTNSPNKFLGSGMLPPNAYVTLEHEHILIFRKGDFKRDIEPKSENRYQSAFFWEERNKWFSDIWDDIRGVSQNLNKKNSDQKKLRERSAAYPLEIPYRLINMFSLYKNTVLDPFWGTGTTSLAAMISGRNSIGYEIDSEFMKLFKMNILKIKKLNKDLNNERLNKHINFIKKYRKEVKEPNYNSEEYDFPVITKQETGILLYAINSYSAYKNKLILRYEKFNFDSKMES
ncbi:MAG: site-specific DNA-methyltransferase [Promethearchaeota archaeon]|nr:MAG: site-specific DNA-methyltransferase [Candidatus Lokiarchaeota archaeon]